MSVWELKSFAVFICLQEIFNKENWELESYNDLIEVDPQIWITDENKKLKWIIVRDITNDEERDYKYWMELIKNKNFWGEHEGYFAGIDYRPYKGKNTFYRGDPIEFDFTGFESIKV